MSTTDLTITPGRPLLCGLVFIHQAGAEIGTGIRSGIIHIEPERPRIITIIPITAETGTITGIKIGIIRPTGSCRTAPGLDREAAFIGALNGFHPIAGVAGQAGSLGEGIAGTIVLEILEGRLDVAGTITINPVNPPKQVSPKIFNAHETHLGFAAAFAVAHPTGIGAARGGNAAVVVGVAIPKGRLPVPVLIHNQVKALKKGQRVEGNKLIAGSPCLGIIPGIGQGNVDDGGFAGNGIQLGTFRIAQVGPNIDFVTVPFIGQAMRPVAVTSGVGIIGHVDEVVGAVRGHFIAQLGNLNHDIPGAGAVDRGGGAILFLGVVIGVQVILNHAILHHTGLDLAENGVIFPRRITGRHTNRIICINHGAFRVGVAFRNLHANILEISKGHAEGPIAVDVDGGGGGLSALGGGNNPISGVGQIERGSARRGASLGGASIGQGQVGTGFRRDSQSDESQGGG